MTSLDYDVIFSRLLSKIEAYDFIELPAEELNDFLCNWIHSASANPYVRKLFKTFILDDDIQEISYEIKYSVDEQTDYEFIAEVLSLGMVVAWLEPKIYSINNIAQMFGTKEEKLRELGNSHGSLHLETLQCIPSYMLEHPYSRNTKTER